MEPVFEGVLLIYWETCISDCIANLTYCNKIIHQLGSVQDL